MVAASRWCGRCSCGKGSPVVGSSSVLVGHAVSTDKVVLPEVDCHHAATHVVAASVAVAASVRSVL